MLYVPRWQIILIVLVTLASIIVTLPNFFSQETVDSWPNWMPKQRIVLGLDLQGGAYLLYEVDKDDYVQQRLRTLTSDVRQAMLQNPRIGYSNLGVQGQNVQLRVRELDRLGEVRERLELLRSPLDAGLLGGGATTYEFDLTVSDDGLVRMRFSDAGLDQRIRGIVAQSIEVIGRRIDELGTTEPGIQRQGADRILVEAPGLGDPTRLKELVGQTAQLTFHLVQNQSTAAAVASTAPEPGTIAVPDVENPDFVYIVDEAPLMTGEDLIDAQASFDQQTSEPQVVFRLSTSGARKFGEVTSANVGRPFAIILDNEVISAPVIREPILGGTGSISGSFTVQTANDLAILLRAGSLPAKLTIVEERTVGPSLGRDSIRAGIIAIVVATLAVVIFMVVCYGILGFFADLALIANNFLILGTLTVLGATLTLPGIAGIVLTIGMAVDANVLIYERMREEAMAGRSVVNALDAGFKRAFATIIDSHLTALIAAIALFWLGSGPIRGFAVTMAIGIVATLFTSYLVTRLIVVLWYGWTRPKAVPL